MTAPETPPSIKPGTILPTVGRRVWFFPRLEACTGAAGEVGMFQLNDATQPLDAGIVYVWSAGMVNLDVTDHAGRHHAVTSVHLLQGDENPLPGESYATWMPYQQNAAKKDAAPTAPQEPAPYVHPTRREEMLYALASGAAITIAQAGTDTSDRIANNILAVVNKLHPQADPAPAAPHTASGIVIPDVHSTTTAGTTAAALDDIQVPTRWAHGEAPRVLATQVEDEIVRETYTVLPSGRVTICELTMRNGFTVWGASAVVFSENNVPETGRKIAREKAVDQVWQHLGYAIREKHA